MRIGIVQITDRCNYHCKGCNPSNTTFADENVIISSILSNRIRIVSLTGGEPTLHPKLTGIVAELRKKHRIIHIASNGWDADRIIESRPHAVSISLDSNIPSEHNEYRGYRYAFERAISTIRQCKRQGIRVYANCLITTFNYNKIPQICEWVNRELKVRLGICYPSSEGYIYSHNIASIGQINRAFFSIIMDDFGKYANCHSYFVNAYYHTDGIYTTECSAGKDIFYIDATGKIYACFLKNKYTRGCDDCFTECFREPSMMNLVDKIKLLVKK